MSFQHYDGEIEDGGVQDIKSGPDVRTAKGYHADRASARSLEERAAHFEHWWETRGAPYAEAVREAGDEPWTDSLAERRALWMRRYQRPAPPAMPTMTGIPRSHGPEITYTEELQAA